jgi:queuosine precursor transporter
MRWIVLLAFLATIPAANWLIGNVGTFCVPSGPCLIPVGLGLTAPSGVLLIGAAMVLRDIVHEKLGAQWTIAAILIGGALSYLVAPASLASASAAAFLLSEAADMLVYSPLRRKRLMLALIASGVVGSIVDSAAFLLLAFGSLDYLAGQVVGKVWMTALAAVVLLALRARKLAGAAR